MVKLISLDLDGTLLDSERRIPEENRKAICQAKERGVEIVISTGSPYGLIPHDELGDLDISYAITANGSAIYEYKTGRCIYEDCIKTEEIFPVLNILLTRDMHIDIFIQGKAFCPLHTRSIVDKLVVPRSRKQYILNNRIWLKNTASYIRENNLSIQKITMNFYPDINGQLVDRAEVKELLEHNALFCLASGGWGNLEITKKGVNKGKALIKLCEIQNISIKDTMAIGDSLNDLDIIQTAGIGVAMGNSMQEVINAADYVTSTNNVCGVAEVINRVLSGQV